MDKERRRSPRIKKALAVLYTSYEKAGQKNQTWNMTSVQDISKVGMRIIINEDFFTNEVLIFRIKVPSRPFEWQKIKGKIVGIERLINASGESVASQHIARIEFIETQDKQKWFIEKYIHWFLEQSRGG